MGLLQRQSKIERLGLASGWLLAERENDYYRFRPKDGMVRYIDVRYRENVATASFQTSLPVQFPIASVPPDLFKMILMRNGQLRYAGWYADIIGSCDVIFRLMYIAIKDGLTPGLFNAIGQELIGEREAVHDDLRNQFARLNLGRANTGLSAVQDEDVRQSLPPRGNRAITWQER